MKAKKTRNEKLRYNIVNMLIYIVGIVLLLQLFNLQIVNGEEYRETSNTRLTRESSLKAARGNVTDRAGNKLVTTKVGYSLEIYKTKLDNNTFNQTILNLVELLEKNKDKYIDNFPITVDPYKYTLEEESLKQWKEENKIEENTTPEQAFAIFKEKYGIEEQDVKKARKIIAVRYEMTRNGISNIKPVTVSKNISSASVNQIEEQSAYFPGVAIAKEPVVTYPYGNLASHILGYLGAISPEEYKEKKDTYDINDIIGKTGIEYTLEDYLKGQDGVKQIEMSVDGTITGEYTLQEAVKGADVSLTIDANLQKSVEKALANNIKKIKNGGYGKAYNAEGGAAIVMNIKTGEVLAMASNPDYEPELYIKGISTEKLKEYDKGKSLYNRAISGQYAPGSTFKMVVATAALETNVIKPTTRINDTGVYPRGYHPTCWYYSEHHYGHGYLTLPQAIQKSCNYYFYEIGYRMGSIQPVIDYAKAYGLGSLTGIELSGEATGTVDLIERCKETTGSDWQFGDTLSAVIGQSYNEYTPIQMARYISMIANGGKAVDVTLIKSITLANGTQVDKAQIEQTVNNKLGIQNTKLQNLNLKKETLNAILKGMKGVTSEYGGTAYYIFSDLGMDIGGKTGSVETNIEGKVNGWFAGFAPYNDPEIAVVVLIENAGSGGNTAPVAKEIIKEYFGMNAKNVEENTTAIPSTESVR